MWHAVVHDTVLPCAELRWRSRGWVLLRLKRVQGGCSEPCHVPQLPLGLRVLCTPHPVVRVRYGAMCPGAALVTPPPLVGLPALAVHAACACPLGPWNQMQAPEGIRRAQKDPRNSWITGTKKSRDRLLHSHWRACGCHLTDLHTGRHSPRHPRQRAAPLAKRLPLPAQPLLLSTEQHQPGSTERALLHVPKSRRHASSSGCGPRPSPSPSQPLRAQPCRGREIGTRRRRRSAGSSGAGRWSSCASTPSTPPSPPRCRRQRPQLRQQRVACHGPFAAAAAWNWGSEFRHDAAAACAQRTATVTARWVWVGACLCVCVRWGGGGDQHLYIRRRMHALCMQAHGHVCLPARGRMMVLVVGVGLMLA